MSFVDAIGSQFIDVIEYVDNSDKILVNKYERPGNEIKQGAKLIVREGQVAAFLKGGQLAGIIQPGIVTLNTKNLPFLSTLGALQHGFNSPIKADLYFLNTRQFINNKWGTKNPIIIRDKEFGMVRVRAFGTFAFRIIDASLFIREILAARHLLKTYDIITYLTSLITESAARIIAEAEASILDLATRYQEFSQQVISLSNESMTPIGMAFSSVVIENISLPDEVEKLIDEQSGIGMATRNMDSFMQYQTARAMRDAAQQDGGLAGLGAGVAFGNTIAQGVTPTSNASTQQIDPIEEIRKYKSLLDEAIITQEEFEGKKREILGS